MLKGIVGDALLPQDAPPLIIAHVLSTAGAYGAGFAAQVARRWPTLPTSYRQWVLPTLPGFDRGRLGSVQFVQTDPGITVAHLCAMRGLRSRRNPHPLDDSALTGCLLRLHERAIRTGESIHMPLIGCGLAGGDWPRIKRTLRSIFASTPYLVCIYKLPEEQP